MKKLIMIVFLTFAFTAPALAADVKLEINVPSAWVSATVAAVTDKWPIPEDWFPESPQSVRTKKWTEHKLRSYLQNIIAPYKTKLDRQAALDAGEFVPTGDTDIPIEISQ